MAAPRLTFEMVAQACEACLLRGEDPSLRRLRTILGGGSFSTLGVHQRTWKQSQEKRPGEPQGQVPEIDALRTFAPAAMERIRTAFAQEVESEMVALRIEIKSLHDQVSIQADAIAALEDEVELHRQARLTAEIRLSEREEISAGLARLNDTMMNQASHVERSLLSVHVISETTANAVESMTAVSARQINQLTEVVAAAAASALDAAASRQRDYVQVLEEMRALADGANATERSVTNLRELVAAGRGRRELEIQKALRILGQKIAVMGNSIRSQQ